MKERVDVLLVQQGFFDSREKAKRAVMAGLVHNEHDRLDKPGMKIDAGTPLFVKGNLCPYVSRGGYKLEKALQTFNINIKDKIMADIGSSTGGFTDCALQNGAAKVYAIDVGTNQLVWKLRNDPRVIVLEQTNFRYATKELFKEGLPDFATIDVSFISLYHIFKALKDILEDGSFVIALIKPQFEAGKSQVGKKGIVKDPKVHLDVVKKVIDFCNENDFGIQELTFSPITGGEGNIEFLALFVKGAENTDISIEDVIHEAHATLK